MCVEGSLCFFHSSGKCLSVLFVYVFYARVNLELHPSPYLTVPARANVSFLRSDNNIQCSLVLYPWCFGFLDDLHPLRIWEAIARTYCQCRPRFECLCHNILDPRCCQQCWIATTFLPTSLHPSVSSWTRWASAFFATAQFAPDLHTSPPNLHHSSSLSVHQHDSMQLCSASFVLNLLIGLSKSMWSSSVHKTVQCDFGGAASQCVQPSAWFNRICVPLEVESAFVCLCVCVCSKAVMCLCLRTGSQGYVWPHVVVVLCRHAANSKEHAANKYYQRPAMTMHADW